MAGAALHSRQLFRRSPTIFPWSIEPPSARAAPWRPIPEGEVEVSDPQDPAEKEADSVGDEVADKLHTGKDDEKDGAEKAPGKAEKEVPDEKAPEIGAKLEGQHAPVREVLRATVHRGKAETLAALKSGPAPRIGSGGQSIDAFYDYVQPGAGFSFAYHPRGVLVALASGAPKWSDGTPINGAVDQFGGHAEAAKAVLAAIGADASNLTKANPEFAKLVGGVIVFENGAVSIRWNSGTINQTNYNDRAAPAASRPGVIAAVQALTGKAVNG